MIEEIYDIHLNSPNKTNSNKIKTGYVWSRKEKVILSLTEEEGIKNKWIIRLMRSNHYWEKKVKNESEGMAICSKIVEKYDLEPNPDKYAYFTVCKECKNLIEIEQDNRNKALCKAVKRNVERDPYDGIEKYYDYDENNKKFFTNTSNRFCKSINTYGKCRYFETKWKVGDLAYIPNAVYDYFRKPSKITKIEGEYAWLDVPDDNPVKLSSLKKVVKYNEKEMS